MMAGATTDEGDEERRREELDRVLDQMATAFLDKNVPPHGFVLMASVVLFFVSLNTLMALGDLFSKWAFRMVVIFGVLALASPTIKEWALRLLGPVGGP